MTEIEEIKQIATQAQRTVNRGFMLTELAIATKVYTNSLIKGRKNEVLNGSSPIFNRWFSGRFPDIHTYGPFGPRY